jgi:uncharacterized protein (TIGR02246 family)
MKKIEYAALLMVVCLMACAAPQGSMPSVEIEALGAQWQQSLNSGDVEAVASLYSEDCRVMPPNAALAMGRDAVRSDFGAMIAAGMTSSLETIEAVESGDSGHRVGVYTLMGPDGSVVDRGKYIETWKKIDGSWQITNDIWNSDNPPAPAGQLMFFSHDVKDFDHWLAAWTGPNSRHELFAAHGAPSVKVFQNAENSNRIGILVDVVDMEAVQAMLESEEGATAKAEDGVIDETMKVYAAR